MSADDCPVKKKFAEAGVSLNEKGGPTENTTHRLRRKKGRFNRDKERRGERMEKKEEHNSGDSLDRVEGFS